MLDEIKGKLAESKDKIVDSFTQEPTTPSGRWENGKFIPTQYVVTEHTAPTPQQQQQVAQNLKETPHRFDPNSLGTPQPAQPQQQAYQQQPQQGLQQSYMEAIRFPQYEVMQVTLKEKFIGTGSKNLSELEKVINNKCRQGFKLHSFSTASAESVGIAGGDRIQATLVFEKL